MNFSLPGNMTRTPTNCPRVFHDLRPRIDEDTMHGGCEAAQLVHAACGHKEAERKFALSLLVERADYFTKVIDLGVGGRPPRRFRAKPNRARS